MALIGYARVSSVGQSLAVQHDRLQHCDKIFEEKQSGTMGKRPRLTACWSMYEKAIRLSLLVSTASLARRCTCAKSRKNFSARASSSTFLINLSIREMQRVGSCSICSERLHNSKPSCALNDNTRGLCMRKHEALPLVVTKH